VAGTDYDLDFVQRISQEVSAKLFEGQGEVAIVSNQGLIVAESRYPNLIGQHFQQVLPGSWRPALDSIQKGERLARLDDNGMMIVLAPIHLGRTGKPWSMMLKIDKQIVLAKATELKAEMDAQSQRSMLQQVGAGVVISLLAVIALWLSARAIALPIRRAAQLAGAIQKGDFSQRLGHRSADEVGQLSASLDRMADSLQEQVHVAERVSQGDLAVEVRLASERDQLGLALRRMVDNLNELVSQVQLSSGLINDKAGQVTRLSHELSTGATESVSAVTEISATINQMAVQIRQTSEFANEANSLSRKSEHSARGGNELSGDVEGRHAGDQSVRPGYHQHHQSDRGDRDTDQPACPERGHRGGSRRRAWSRIRRGRGRGATARGTQCRGRATLDPPDSGIQRADGQGYGVDRRHRASARGHRSRGSAGIAIRGRDCADFQPAGVRHRTGQPGHRPDR